MKERYLVAFVFISILFVAKGVSAKTLVALKIKPENVGVFMQNKTQQFQAFAVFSDGSEENYTDRVGWSLKADPLSDQNPLPWQVASINQNGLVTVKGSWGRVKVVATYPKPPPIELTGPYRILLKSKCDQFNLGYCSDENACKNAGGYWWRDHSCHDRTQPATFLATIYLILFGS